MARSSGSNNGGRGSGGGGGKSDATEDALARILSVAGSRKRSRGAVSVLGPAGELPPGATERVLRVAAYCRYSSHMQDDGYSIERQHRDIDQEVLSQAQRGVKWQLRYFDEPAKSAKAEKLHMRVQFLEMLKAALSGEFDLIVVAKLNRFSRNELVMMLVFNELERASIGFLSLAERFDVTTPAGWIALRLHMALAESDNRERAAAIAGGKRERAVDGLYGCRVPFGYRKALDAVQQAVELSARDARAGTRALGKAPAEPDRRIEGSDEPRDWDGLQMLIGLWLQGMTDQETADTMNRDGRWFLRAPGGGKRHGQQRAWTRQAVSALRRNPFYRPYRPGDSRGTIAHNGTEHRGQHEAACTWEQWRTVQQVASGRRRGWLGYTNERRKEPHTAEFRGLAACSECGGRLYVWRTVHDKNKRTGEALAESRIYERYVCTASDRGETCSQDRHWARVEHVREAWVAWLRAQRLPDGWTDVIRERAAAMVRSGEDGEEGEGNARRDTARAARELRNWEEKRRRVLKQYRDLDLSEDEYHALLAECDVAIERLASATAGAQPHVTRLVEAGRILTQAADLWPHMTTQERQQAAALMLAPGGLRLRLTGARGYYNRWTDEHELPPSCEIVGEPALRPAFRELLATVSSASAAG